jgi:LacI family transcriptional regulator, gluconate utilization system Gnt-I transcriptional repressor
VTNPIQSSKSSKDGFAPIPEAIRGRGHGRVTLADVALQAGVTTMTVSRFLRSPERVAASTAEKITQALQATGYSPNLQAGSLASGRSQAVAVIVPNIAHSIFADTLHGLGLGLQSAGLQMLVSSTGYSLEQEEQQVRTVLGWAPAAMVVTGRKHLPATQQLLLAAQLRGTPVMELWDQSPAGEPHDFQQIGFDHTQVGAAQAKALIERGCTRLAFMDVSVEEDFRAHERAQGFIAKANAMDIPVELLMAGTGDAVAQGGQCFAAWYAKQSSQECFGVGFANDLLGTGALLQAQSLGCEIPQRLQLLGFGDFPVARYCLGGLSTMHIDGESMGQACAEYISQQLKPNALQMRTAPSQLMIRPRLLWRAFNSDFGH